MIVQTRRRVGALVAMLVCSAAASGQGATPASHASGSAPLTPLPQTRPAPVTGRIGGDPAAVALRPASLTAGPGTAAPASVTSTAKEVPPPANLNEPLFRSAENAVPVSHDGKNGAGKASWRAVEPAAVASHSAARGKHVRPRAAVLHSTAMAPAHRPVTEHHGRSGAQAKKAANRHAVSRHADARVARDGGAAVKAKKPATVARHGQSPRHAVAHVSHAATATQPTTGAHHAKARAAVKTMPGAKPKIAVPAHPVHAKT